MRSTFPASTIASSLFRQAQDALAQRDLELALQLFQQAELHGADPDSCANGRWEVSMLLGNFEAAWQQNDALRLRKAPDPHRLWNNRPVRGKRTIVRCLHGLGDAIQFLRYASELQKLTPELAIQVAPTLVPLASCIPGVGHAITWDELSLNPRTNWETELEIMELPYLFRTTLNSIPNQLPYLHVPVADLDRVKDGMLQMEGPSPLPRVGVCWSCGSWNRSRAVALEALLPLFSQPEFSFYSLQDGLEGSEWTAKVSPRNCHDAGEFGPGPLTLAAVIAQLDLVITVDTLAAHIAGALARPVWLLLPYAADWRWMHNRSDSPWYPSMRIYRQQTPGNWSSVLQSVKRDLASLRCGHSGDA